MVTIITGSTHNRTDMSTTGIIQEQSLDTAWGEMRDEAPLTAFLNMMPSARFPGVANSTKVQWAQGDYPDEDTTLGAALTFDDSEGAPTDTTAWVTGGAAARITLAESRFFKDDIIQIFDATNKTHTTFKLGSLISGTTYAIKEVISSQITDGGGDITFASGSRVEILASAVDYDGEARDFLNVRAALLYNYMQRIRKTVGAGQVERSNQYLADRSLERLVRLGFRSFSKEIEKSLFLNHTAKIAGTGETDTGLMGGLPFFLNPHGATSGTASTTLKGINKVFSGSSISYNDLVTWMEELTVKGSKEKLVFLSPYMMGRVLQALQGVVALQRENFGTVNPGFSDVWTNQTADLAFGKLKFVVNRGLTGVRQRLVDKDTATAANSLAWMVAVDPTDVGMQYLDVTGEGVATPRIRDVFKERNNSIEEIEFDTIATFSIGDMEAHGYFGITG